MHGRHHPAYSLARGLTIARLVEYALAISPEVRGSGEARSTSVMALKPWPFLKGATLLYFRRGAMARMLNAGSSIRITVSTCFICLTSLAAWFRFSLILPPSSAWSRSRGYRAGLCFTRPKMGANRAVSRCHFQHLPIIPFCLAMKMAAITI